jgi:hypothetical protein
MKHFHSIAAIIVIATIGTPAAAAPITYNDKAIFLGAAGSSTIYGFEAHNLGEGVELVSPLSAGNLDNNFDLAVTNLNSLKIINNVADPGVVDGTHSLFTHSYAPPVPNYTLTFANFGGASAGITAFGLTITDFASGLTANDPAVSITYQAGGLSGTLLNVLMGQADYTQNFIGLTVDPVDAFSSITLTFTDNQSGMQWFDEVIYSQEAQVPEPGTLALTGLAALALGWARRRA